MILYLAKTKKADPFFEGMQQVLLLMGTHREGGQFPGMQEGKLSWSPNQGADFYKIYLLVALQIFLHMTLEGAANLS